MISMLGSGSGLTSSYKPTKSKQPSRNHDLIENLTYLRQVFDGNQIPTEGPVTEYAKFMFV